MSNEDYRITLQLQGHVDEDGYVGLGQFAQFLQAMLDTIRQADRAETGRQTVRVRLVDISRASPYRATAEMLASDPKVDERPKIMRRLQSVQKVGYEDQQGYADVSYSLLESYQKLTSQVGKAVPDATLTVGADVIPLSPALHARIGAALAPVVSAIGAVEGRLEAINIHGGANHFHIYPALGPSKVKCHFQKKLEDQATGAVGKKVKVHGITRYRAGAKFPHEVEVTSIEVLKSDEDLPTLASLKGASPPLAGGASEEIIRRIRNGWE